jgi:hypothetical protein
MGGELRECVERERAERRGRKGEALMNVMGAGIRKRQPAISAAGCRFPRMAWALGVLAAGACAPHAPTTQTPSPASDASSPSAAAAARSSLPPRYAAGHREYQITSVGVVSDSGDTTGHLDTVTAVATLRYDARWDGVLLRVTGDIASRVVTASLGLRITTPPQTALVPFRAAIDSATGIATIDPASTPSGSSCPIGGPSVSQARDLATTYPRSFVPGSSWRLSLADTSCLGGLPLVSSTSQRYTVANQAATDPVTGAAAILVTHRSMTTMMGCGPRGAQTITLSGTGSGTTEQYYDRATGALLSAHTTATLDLDVGVSGHVQRLRQQADWRARAKS